MAGWLFRKRLKALPGVFVNISKSGFGLGLGIRGANISLGRRGVYLNTGIPGSGIYRRDKLLGSDSLKKKPGQNKISNKPNKIISTISTYRQENPKIKKNESYVTIEQNNKKRIIINNFLFGRAECKSSFGYCNDIYTKQFSILKDQSGDWFIHGYNIPKSAKNKEGETLNFYPTIYNGINITNMVIKLVNNGEIKIGTRKIRVKINN
jgi:hypothetical protein